MTTPYLNPFRNVQGFSTGRIDQGVDYSGSGPVYALGPGHVVVAASSGTGWPGGGFIAYRLSGGPNAGQFVYLAENVSPNVRAGQSVDAGTVIGHMHGGIETGWAAPNVATTDQTLAFYRGHECKGADPGCRPTPEGISFNQLMQSIGVGGGTPTTTPGLPSGVSAPGLIQTTGSVWGIPFNFWTSAAAPVTGIVTAVEDIAQAISGVSNVAAEVQHLIGMIAWWFVPSHIVRVLSFLVGAPLVGFGVWNLSRTGQPYALSVPVVGEVPASGGSLAPVIGIMEVTVGSVLLFIAFHNLPATVVDLPSLLTYIQSNVAKPGSSGGQTA